MKKSKNSGQDKKSIKEIMGFAHNGDLQRLKRFFPQDVNVKDDGGATMLIWAAFSNRIEVAEFLMDKGADPDIKSKDELTAMSICANGDYVKLLRMLAPKTADHNVPLRAAARSGHVGIVKYLLNLKPLKATDLEGAFRVAASSDQAHVVSYLLRIMGKLDKLAFNAGVHAAVVSGSVKATKVLLAELEDPLKTSICECHCNVLHLAAAHDQVELARYLQEAGADINFVDDSGNTALHIAAASQKTKMVAFLANAGANIEARKSNGCTALQSACATGNLDMIKVLHNAKANVGALDNQGCTPLHSAAFGGFLDVTKYLIETLGADPTVRSNDESSVLHAAVATNSVGVAKYLSTMVDVNAKDDEGHTPARLAVSEGHFESLVFLIDECKANVNVVDDEGWTLLHVAASKGRLKFAKYLLEKGVSPNAKDSLGNTALYYAANNDHAECAVCLLDITTAPEADGVTPLHVAASRGNTATVCAIARPHTINVKTQFGFTPVCAATTNGHLGAVKELAVQGANLELGTNNNYTPLHLASEAGHFKVVKFLLKTCHVRAEAKTNQGCTALMCATQNCHVQIIKYLVRRADSSPRLDSKCGTAIDLAKIAAKTHPEMWDVVDWLSRRCSSCGRWGKYECSGCENVYYCNVDCQAKNRAAHKSVCKK
jgi:ankyrin repeat protein